MLSLKARPCSIPSTGNSNRGRGTTIPDRAHPAKKTGVVSRAKLFNKICAPYNDLMGSWTNVHKSKTFELGGGECNVPPPSTPLLLG